VDRARGKKTEVARLRGSASMDTTPSPRVCAPPLGAREGQRSGGQMGLRSKVKTMLSAPLGALLDAALRELVEASLDARGLVRQAEVDAITDRVEGFRRELAERRTGLDALRQALDAWARDQEDELDASLEVGLDLADADARLTGLEEGYEDLKRRIERSAGAVEIARAQLEALHGRLAVVDERSAKAALVANAAQSAAEAAADGVAGLESTPQR
jgi:hypothetical protein